jgi:ribosomal protein L10
MESIMQREQKQQMIHELHEKFTRARFAVVGGFQGLTVEEMTAFRRKLKKAGGELRVVKNTLAARAAAGTDLGPVTAHFTGPISVILGYEDPVRPAKVVKEFADSQEGKFSVKAGVIEGRVVDRQGVKAIASLPSREQLIGQLVSRLNSPISGLVWNLKGILNRLVWALSAVEKQKGSAGSATGAVS